jgi:demethylmenaquinone methyltransferase / 2-methoxy-6-polyprenyl-1,4-benzoquinol methylase
MAKFSHDTIVPFKDSPLAKKQQVAEMFDRIASRYDFLNRFLSGGIDLRWRKKAIAELAAYNPKQILDVATGTADMAILMSRRLSPETITGIDISEGMLEIGKKKIGRLHLDDKIRLLPGDSEAIPFPDNHFDAVTVAFGVRNFEHLEKGLSEIQRVLKPGGRLIILEFSQPRAAIWRQLCRLYCRVVAPGIGKMLSRSREAYRYLNESVQAFPEGRDFIAILEGTGYAETAFRPLSMGICSIYRAAKIPL